MLPFKKTVNTLKEIKSTPIGVVHSPYKEATGVPIQPARNNDVTGTIEIFPEYAKGLKDIEGFSHIFLIYHFHLIKKTSLSVIPFLDEQTLGVYATRAPSRPNHIGLSMVKLLRVEDNILHISNLDIVEGTPLLDIKPCIPDFDFTNVKKVGWLEQTLKKLPSTEDDGRFVK